MDTNFKKLQYLEEKFKDAVYSFDKIQCQSIMEELIVNSDLGTISEREIYRLYFEGIYEFTFNDDSYNAETIFESLFTCNLSIEMQINLYQALGRCYDFQGRFDLAIETYEHCIEVAKIFGSDYKQATGLQSIGGTCIKGFLSGQFGLSKLQKGIDCCKVAQKLISQKSDNESTGLTGSIWNVLGILYMCDGQWIQAINYHQQCLEIFQVLGIDYYAGYVYGNIGEVYIRQYLDNTIDSVSIDKALSSFQKALELLGKSGDGYQEAEALVNLGYFYQTQESSIQSLPYYVEAIDLIENSREQISDPSARAEFFTTMVDTYANTILTCIAMNDYEQAFHYAERARSRTYLDLLNPPSQDTDGTVIANLPVLSVQEIQQRLPKDAVLLVYFTTGSIEASDRNAKGKRKPKRYRFPKEKTLVFVFTHEIFELIDLNVSPNDIRLDKGIDYYHSEKDEQYLSNEIYPTLIEPIQDRLAGKKKVFISLHDFLNDIPFHMVLNEPKPIASSQQLIFTPSATFLCTPSTPSDKPPQSFANESCFVVSYNGSGSNQLRYTEGNAMNVAERMNGKALIGDKPKKSFLFEHSAAYRILYFACHGAFSAAQPLQSKLYIGPDEELTAKEVQEQLTLNNALVIMGACESGVSQVRRGNELMGFVRAFIQAGARAVIATQWEVSEISTRILMEKFFEEVQSEQDIGTALHNAQCYLRSLSKQEVIQQLMDFCQGELDEAAQEEHNKICAGPEYPLADPYYWAAFILVANLDTIQ